MGKLWGDGDQKIAVHYLNFASKQEVKICQKEITVIITGSAVSVSYLPET